MKTRTSRRRRWLIIAASLVAAYLIVGFLVLPPITRSQIQQRLTAALDRPVTVERVRMNPLTFSVTVAGLRVADHDGADLTSWSELYANADPLTSLFKWRWHLGEFRLVDYRSRLVVDEHGALNIADLIAKYAPADGAEPAAENQDEANEELPRAGIGRLRIQNAALDFSDRSRATPFHTTIGPMSFNADGLTTRREAASPYSFSGTTDTGESFAWAGNISVAPLGSTGHIAFSSFSIPKHMPFVEHLFSGAVRSGRFSFEGDYRVVLAAAPVMQIENAVVAVDELSVTSRDASDSLLKLARVQVDVTRADALQRTAEIARVGVDGFDMVATRRAGGSIDVLEIMQPSATPAAATPEPTDPGPAPSVSVALLEVNNARVAFNDTAHSRPARVALDQIALTATNAGTDLDREIGLKMSARWNERGTLSAEGVVRALPMAAQLSVKGEAISLAGLDPLIEPWADIRVTSGDVWFTGRIEAARAPGETLTATWTGDAGLDALDLRDADETELAQWKRVALTGTEFHLSPLGMRAHEIAIEEPVVNLALDENGQVNLLSVLPAAAEPTQTSAPEQTPETATQPETPAATTTSERLAAATRQKLAFDAQIETVALRGARVSVKDQHFAPGFATELRDFSGTIRGLSSENLARADVDLQGTLDGVAPLRVTGKINPLADDVYSDLTVLFSNIDLPMFSPYAGRYIGQKIAKGKLRVDLAYKLSQRDLVGENRILFDQFFLGERVESADALKLPIGLALALLRDRNGQIPLDVPVRGNLDDPDFKYGRVVWQAIGNIVVKAATSPFSLLGSMFGGADLDLSYADFASGSAEISPDATRKLEVITKALYERPALRLEITSPPSPDGDRAGLVQAAFHELLRAEKGRQLGAMDDAAAESSVPVEVAPEEVDALTAAVFLARFPEEAATVAEAQSAGAVPAPAIATEMEPEDGKRPGLLRRAWRTLFGGDEDAPSEEPAKAAESPSAASDETAPAAPPLTIEAMRERVLATISPAPMEFEQLARARAAMIRDALLATGQVEAERVFILDSTTVPAGATAPTDGGRVFFGLN